MRTHDGPHDGTHDGCFGCKIKGVQLSPAATPSRRTIKYDERGFPVLRKAEDPSWERGIKGEHRPGGGFMPYLNEKGQEIRVKEWGEKRSIYEPKLRELRGGVST